METVGSVLIVSRNDACVVGQASPQSRSTFVILLREFHECYEIFNGEISKLENSGFHLGFSSSFQLLFSYISPSLSLVRSFFRTNLFQFLRPFYLRQCNSA